MKKILSLSLVASATILSLNAGAQDLSEAIKNVDISGTAAYRYNDYDSGTHTNNYKIATSISSKVNDDVTANTRFVIESFNMNTTSANDSNVDVRLSEVNFAYTGIQGLSVTVGKQGIATPWTVSRDAMGSEQTGTGAVAAYTAGSVTLVGAYFNQTNFGTDDQLPGGFNVNGAEDFSVIGGMGTVAGITLDAFYADLADTFDSYTVGVKASYNVGDVALSPFARYSSLDRDDVTTDNALWQIGMGADMGIFSAFVAYGESDKEGGVVAVDGSAQTNMDYHWRVTADGSADTEYLYAHVDVDVTDKVNVGLFYSEADYAVGGNADINEVYVQAKYKMSSNFYTYVRLGQLDEDGQEKVDMGRLHVQYSF